MCERGEGVGDSSGWGKGEGKRKYGERVEDEEGSWKKRGVGRILGEMGEGGWFFSFFPGKNGKWGVKGRVKAFTQWVNAGKEVYVAGG